MKTFEQYIAVHPALVPQMSPFYEEEFTKLLGRKAYLFAKPNVSIPVDSELE